MFEKTRCIKVNKTNKKGEVAMGTLIIFIAMILIAAVAAAVLITSIGDVQSRALQTGSATMQEIGTNINVVEIYADQQSPAEDTLNNFSMVVRLAAGSEPVRIQDILLTVGTPDATDEFTSSGSGDTFTVVPLLQSDNYDPAYIQSGDVVKIEFDTSAAVGEDVLMRFTLIPKIGTPTTVFASTPTTISNSRETVFP